MQRERDDHELHAGAEIEITPQMEAAGIQVLEDSGYLDEADSGFRLLPRQVFAAMWRHRPQGQAGVTAKLWSLTDMVRVIEDWEADRASKPGDRLIGG